MKRHRGGRFDIRFLARALAVAGTALAVSVCGEQGSFGGTTGPEADATPPVVQIILPTDTLIEIADSLKFTINSTDNTKLKAAHVSVAGLGTFALAVTKDTTFAVGATVTMYTQAFVVPLPTNAAGQRIAINATATDANDNVTTLTDTVRVNDAQTPVVTMLTPSASVLIGSGDTINVLARATDPSGVRYLGARLFVRDTVLGRVQTLAVDSLLYTSRQNLRLDSFRIVVPTALAPGNYILQAFSADSSPFFNKGASPDLTVAVRDVRPPTGSFNGPALDSQVVAGDALPVSFRASDNVGVVSVRFRGYSLRANPNLGPPDTTLRFQALTAQFPLHPADTNPVVRRLEPVLSAATADSVLIEAILTDIGGNVTTLTRRIQVVAGLRAVTIQSPLLDNSVSAGDSVLVQFRVQDNRGAATVTIEGFAIRGDSSLGTATEVPHFVAKTISLNSATDTTLRRYLNANAETRAEPVFVRVTAFDAAGTAVFSLLRIQVITGASARVASPSRDTTFAVGNPLAVTVSGFDPDSVQAVGYVSAGAIARRDSSVYASPLGQARTAALSLPVPGTTPLTADTITPFVIDRLGNRTVGEPIVVTFQDLTPPTLTFVSPTVDTGVAYGAAVPVQVRVRDNAYGTAVSLIGRAVSAAGQTQTWFSTVNVAGLGSVDTTVARALPAILVDPAGALVYLVATATDAVGNSVADSIRIRVNSGPYVRIMEPTNGTQIRLGQTGARILPLVEAFSPDTILYLGFQATGRVIKTDSVATTRPLTSTTLAQQLTLVVPDTTRLGTVTLTPFVRTRSGARLTGSAVSVELIDGSLPVVRILTPARAGTDNISAGDSLFVRVSMVDDRELASVSIAGWARRPDVPDTLGDVRVVQRFAQKDVSLIGTVRDTVVRYLNAVLADSTVENAYIVATVTDAAGNVGVDTVKVNVIAGPRVTLTAPAAGLRHPVGTTLSVTVSGTDPHTVTAVGFEARGVVAQTMSLPVSPAAVASTQTLTWAVPAMAALGVDTLVPFAVNASGRFYGTPVVISLADEQPPALTFVGPLVGTPVAAGDSVLLTLTVQDNRGLDSVSISGVSHRGNPALGTDSVIPRFLQKSIPLQGVGLVTSTVTRYLLPSLTDSTAETVYLVARVRDVQGNVKTDSVAISVAPGPYAAVIGLQNNSPVPVGSRLTLSVAAYDPDTLAYIGYEATGRFPWKDSVQIVRPVPDAVRAQNTLDFWIPLTAALGVDTIRPFARDIFGGRFYGPPVVILFTDNSNPLVDIINPDSGGTGTISASDSLFVRFRARDNQGVRYVGAFGRWNYPANGDSTGHHSSFYPYLLQSDVVPAVIDPLEFSKFRINPVDADTIIRVFLQPTQVAADSAPKTAWIIAFAQDSAENVGVDSVLLSITPAASVRITSPTAGLPHPVGTTLSVTVVGSDPHNLTYVGYVARGVLGRADSLAVSPAAGTSTQTLAWAVPATAALGVDTLVPFARNALGGRFYGTPVVISLADTVVPAISFLGPALDSAVGVGDSVRVRIRVTDNRGVARVDLDGVQLQGDSSLGTASLLSRLVLRSDVLPNPTDTTITRYVNAVQGQTGLGAIYVRVVATDSSGNPTTAVRRINLVAGPYVQITSPTDPAVQPIGATMSVTIRAYDPDGMSRVGFRTTGAVTGGDSISYSTPLLTTQTTTRTLAIPAGARGSVTVTPFSVDSLGNRLVGVALPVTLSDTAKPTVTIDTPAVALLPVNVGDSVYVRVHVGDNLGVTQLVLTGIAHRGSVALGTDTAVTRFVSRTVTIQPTADTVITRYLRAVPGDSTSEVVTITATATDSSGNSGSGTATVRLVSGPTLTIVRPVPGTLTSANKQLVIEVQASDPNGVRFVAYRTTGVVIVSDTVFYSASAGVQPKTVTFSRTLTIPGAAALGTFTITPFAEDSLGDPSGITPGITVTVQNAATDVTPPVVTFAVSRRIEATDSITISATDASGVASMSWTASLLGTPATVYGTGTTGPLGGTSSDVRATFAMNLAGITQYPTQVVVAATATDASSGALVGTAVAETLTVVAGRTFALPGGSNIGDAIYNPNLGELYLSNTALNRIEVFDVATSSFVASIPVGARPVGLALWPSDTTTRANADTLIVANSGGTNLSIVNLVNRVEVRRYRLPNYIIQKVKAELDPAANTTRLTITEYDYSDRPQYVAAVCRSPGPRVNCGDVIALYSTTPTPGQVGYPNRGYLAWENLTSTATDGTKGHFFWEQAAAAISLKTDTLQIIAVRDSVPGTQVRDTILGAGVGQIVDFDQLQFQDSTFVRNSGNYLRALVGEGGTDQGLARVMVFAPTPGTVTINSANPAACTTAGMVCTGTRDRGISDALFVRDFIANRASGVTSIAINQNGLTMLVRADSIYAFNQTLGQTGLMRAGSGAVGMDFHPDNDFDANTRGTGGVGYQDSRLVFAARPDSSIDVFDTFFYGQVTEGPGGVTVPVPIRNSLIGPVRAATRAGNTLLFGLTSFGLVQVQLPSITNPFPTAGLRASAPAPASVPRIVSSGARRTTRDPSPPRE